MSPPDSSNPEIALYELGGAGPTVLYAHATGFHAHCWLPVTTRLDSVRNVAYDARGHGDTPVAAHRPARGPVDWTIYGADAADIAVGLSADGPVLGVGHSMGGAALLMAALSSPQSFRGLVLYEPVAVPTDAVPNGQPSYMAAAARKRRANFRSFEDAIANYSSKPPMNVFTPESMDAYVRYGFSKGDDGHVHLKCGREHEARTFEGGGNHRTWDHLGDITVPVWVICGAPQPMQPSERTRELADRIPGSRYIQLDHLGHFGPLQSPAEIATIVADASAAF